MRIAALEEEFDLDCHYHPFPLHPETPPEGMSLEELFGARMDVAAAMAQLGEVAASLGLAFAERRFTFNSRNAQELGLWAAAQGRFGVWEEAVYHCYFGQGRNIGQPETLMEIIRQLGWDQNAATAVLENRTCAAQVDAEWDKAVSTGVRAVPTLRCEGREQVGFASLAQMRKLIQG